MPNDADISIDEVINDRLEELLFGGHITQIRYQAAIIGNGLTAHELVDYLETCLRLP